MGQTHSSNCRMPANCLSVFDHFVELALKGLISKPYIWNKASVKGRVAGM